jgi:hypothetical protein
MHFDITYYSLFVLSFVYFFGKPNHKFIKLFLRAAQATNASVYDLEVLNQKALKIY